MGVREANYIGSYKELLAACDLADHTASIGGMVGYRKMAMVALLLDEGEEPSVPAFEAGPIYDSMLAERIERKSIEPKKRLRLPRFRKPGL